MEKAVLIHSAELEKYQYPSDCPFSTERAGRAQRIMSRLGLLDEQSTHVVAPTRASDMELEWLHQRAYLEVLKRASQGQVEESWLEMGIGKDDTPAFLGMFDYAALACGASLTGARLILSGEADRVFNPSGGYHHAHAARAAGFCYLNDVALACWLLSSQGRRVLFLDLDAHHSDGVQEFFYHRKDVMTVSLHESGKTLYPGTGFEDEFGDGEGAGYCVNIPLPENTYDQVYLRAFNEVALPLIRAFDPDVLVVEWGMDTLAGDPLTHLKLSNNAPCQIASTLVQLNKPILATGGGGYHIENTARGWALIWSTLIGSEPGYDLAAGMGGVMLQSADWLGGLRDLPWEPPANIRLHVDTAVQNSIQRVKRNVFPFHGLQL